MQGRQRPQLASTNPARHPSMEVLIQPLTCSPAILAANMESCFHQRYWPMPLFPSVCTAPLDSDEFAFFHEGAHGCLGVRDHSLVLSASCEEINQRWKWVTQGRLFNLGSSLCLGMTTGNLTSRGDRSPLGVYTCDREPPKVRWTWNCGQVLDNLNNYLPSPSLWNSSSSSSTPPSSTLKWTLHGGGQDLCSRTYRGKHACNQTSTDSHCNDSSEWWPQCLPVFRHKVSLQSSFK